MRNIVLVLLAIIGSGCATAPHESAEAGRSRVVTLDPGTQPGEARAILLDSQTGETWISSFGSNEWMKLSR